ncbi:SIS domain-containing protein [Spirillospora sp. CA-255316]
MSARIYAASTLRVLKDVVESQHDAIMQAAGAVTVAMLSERRLWAFGTGHSHMISEELFFRAGGFSDVRAVFEPSLMLHEGTLRSSAQERLHGLADTLLIDQDLGRGDVVIIASNSGRNAVPVEFATAAKERGALVIAITSLAHSRSVSSRVRTGRKLFEVADIVIDNCGVPGDAIVPIGTTPIMVSATSTVTGAFIVQSIVAEVAARLDERGARLEVLASSNLGG